jgi:hypothetical protein
MKIDSQYFRKRGVLQEDEKMSIYLLEIWAIKPEDNQKHDLLWQEYIRYMNQNPELFNKIRGMQLCRKLSGDGPLTHAQVVEFDSLEDKESLDQKLAEDRASREFHRKLISIKDPKTTSAIICEPFLKFR